MNQFEKLSVDLKDHHLPRDIERSFAKVKCKITHGCRIRWYYKEDAEFLKHEKLNVREYAGYAGIVVARPDSECGGEMEFDHCVVIIDDYPCEKCNVEVDWVAFTRLIDNEDLVEVFADGK